MRITLRQTGGYAGITKDVAAIETEELDPEFSYEIKQMVGEMGFFHLPPFLGRIGADLVRYELTISEGKRTHTVVFDETNGLQTRSLLALVNLISQAG